jgi:hypothetical protein
MANINRFWAPINVFVIKLSVMYVLYYTNILSR